MKSLATAVLMLCFSLTIGCGSSDSSRPSGPDQDPDVLVIASIDAMNQIVSGIEAGKPKEELAELDAKLLVATEKLKSLRLKRTEMDALIEKHKPELDEAGARLVKAMMAKSMDEAKENQTNEIPDGVQTMSELTGQKTGDMQEPAKIEP